ncbi:hypothetical protein [Desulfogranum marinum]|uniref:hypothetical protein n=1 Tax=Desulfogranum marinum TaxID=453220 RepID=UPI0019668A1B|nr:hypothetical protein [Desulfogranum marinum]MBM9515216.1 hypothetical protein [Desulfogranum marinum]
MLGEKKTDYDHMFKEDGARYAFHDWLRRQKINWLAIGFLIGYVCGMISGLSGS